MTAADALLAELDRLHTIGLASGPHLSLDAVRGAVQRFYGGRPAAPGKPVELMTRDELLHRHRALEQDVADLIHDIGRCMATLTELEAGVSAPGAG